MTSKLVKRGMVEPLESRRLLAGITFDRFAGNNGVTFARPEDQWNFYSGFIAPLDDGRVYVADAQVQGLVSRFLRDGTVDRSFGNNGFINVSDGVAGVYNFRIRQIVAKPDGTLLVAAKITKKPTPKTTNLDIGVYQYTPAGTPDAQFGTGGRVSITAPETNANEDPSDLIVLDNGRIVVAGVSSWNDGNGRNIDRGIMARLNADGSLDSAAPSGGVQIFDEWNLSTQIHTWFTDLLALPGGNYLVAGRQLKYAANTVTPILTRYTSTDQPLASFGTGGTIRSNLYPAVDLLYDPSRDAVVAAGQTLTRFNATTGALDTTLGPNGTRTIATNTVEVLGNRAAIDAEGNINVVTSVAGYLAFTRFTANGNAIGVNRIDDAPKVYFGTSSSYDIAATNGGQLVVTGHVPEFSVIDNAPLSLIRLNTFGLGEEPRLFREPSGRVNLFLSANNDDISITSDASDIIVSWADGETRTARAGLTRLTIADGGGSDTITLNTLDPTLPVDIDLGEGNDLLRLGATAAAGNIRVLGGAGNDRIERSTAAAVGTLTFNGDDGTDRLVLNGTADNDAIVIDDASLATGYALSLAGVESLEADGFAGSDTITVNRIPKDVALFVDSGDDADMITYAGLADTLNNQPAATILGGSGDDVIASRGGRRSLTVNGGAGTDRLRFISEGNGESVTLAASTFTQVDVGTRILSVTPLGLERVSVESPAASTGNTLTLADAAQTVGQSYVISTTSITRSQALGYLLDQTNVSSIVIQPGSGDDTVTSMAAPDLIRVGVSASNGIDRFILDRSADPRSMDYTFDGGAYTVDGSATTYAIVEFATLLGGGGDDTFKVTARTNATLVWTLDGGAGSDSLDVAVAGGSSPVKSIDSPGNGRVTFSNRATVEFRSMETVTLVLPKILSATFNPSSEVIAVTLDFAPAAIPARPPATILQLTNMTTGKTYLPSELTATVSGSTIRLTLINPVSNEGTNRFPDGNYRLVVHGSGLSDGAGNAFGNEFSFDFFVLAGDADRDRDVDFDDLVVLAQNYNTYVGQSPDSNAKGDFNHDSSVNFDDLVLLAQHYNTVLAAMPAPAINAGPTKKRRSL